MAFRAALLLAAAIAPGAAGAWPLEVRDDLGDTVAVAREPRRVVCLSPGATEIVYALGMEAKLVGVCGMCDHPPAARKLPRLGDFANISVESVMARKPDLVLATGGVQKELVLRLRWSKLSVLVLYPHTYKGIAANARTIGEALGCLDRGMQMARKMDRHASIIAGKVKEAATARGSKVRVYFEMSSEPLMTVGGAGYIPDLIAMAGGDNIGNGMSEEYPLVSAEFVINADPEVIILSHSANPAQALEEVKRRRGWEKIKAVRDKRVFADLDMDLLMRPGPRAIGGVGKMFCRFYPGKKL